MYLSIFSKEKNMIIHLLIGALAMTVFFLLVDYVRKREIKLAWWHWTLTVLGIIYTVFVLELIVGFLGEGAPQAALVMGLITGIIAIVWGVLLRRFVFKKA
jgi:hypothetical protein